MTTEWQPIETAPKDATNLLLYDPQDKPNHFFVGFWNGRKWELAHYSALKYYPTHWMPLPSPPAAGE